MWLHHFLCFILVIGFHAAIVNSKRSKSKNVHPSSGKKEIREVITKMEAPPRFDRKAFREKLRKLELEYNSTLTKQNIQ
ncbi:hypothetical protein GCK32_005006 [Trichostrongylus colubriformis]|uniref:Uncharacterized protein n=1 Tax=Trichostrongylus colubriformis TaxID=6319 RepID=A0AAN8FD98_TRICO